MQLGIKNEEAAKEAERHGIKVVQDRCMMKEHIKLK
jgi:predicted CoA-binding protein